MWWEILLVPDQEPCRLQKAPQVPAASLVSSFSETGKCLSRAQASPQAQLACSKAAGVEVCSLSCTTHTLFVPGTPRPGPNGSGGETPFLGSSPCSPGKEPAPGPGHSQKFSRPIPTQPLSP